MDLVWSDVAASDHRGRLSDVLTAYDKSITRHGIDPCSELALGIYAELVKRFREGRLEQKQPTKLSMFSFGKENPFAAVVSVDRIAKHLKFDEYDRTPSTKRLVSKKSGDASLARTAVRSVDTDSLERQLKKHLDKQRKIDAVKTMQILLKFKNLMVQRKGWCFKALRKRLNDESPEIIKRRLRRFKRESAIYQYESTTKTKCFGSWRSLTASAKSVRQRRLQEWLTARNQHMLGLCLGSWWNYTNRREDERANEQRISQLKRLLRKKLFFGDLRRWCNRGQNTLMDQQATHQLRIRLFFQRLRYRSEQKQTNPSQLAEYLFKCHCDHFLAALKKNQQTNEKKTDELLGRLAIFRKRRTVSKLYFNKQFMRQYWLKQGPKQVRLVHLLTDALRWQNTKLGYNYPWMNRIATFESNPKVAGILNRRLMQNTMDELRKRLLFERQNMKAIRDMLQKKAVQRLTHWHRQHQVQLLTREKQQCLAAKNVDQLKVQTFQRLSRKIKTSRHINTIASCHCRSLALEFFQLLCSEKRSSNFVSRQLQTHLLRRNNRIMQQVFSSLKGVLLEQLYSGKILAIAQQRKSTKLLKDIFKYLKGRAFESKRIQVKAKNLLKLRRMEYGEKVLKQFKEWAFLNHHRNGIRHQADRLYVVSTMEKCMKFWRLHTQHTSCERLVEQQVRIQRSQIVLHRYLFHQLSCFSVLKRRRQTKQQQRMKEAPLVRRIQLRKKQELLNLLVGKSVQSMKLRLLSSTLTKLLIRHTYSHMLQCTHYTEK